MSPSDNEELTIHSPNIVVAQWLPMGINNLVSLNRHVGAHKKYGSPTEFGMKGSVDNIEQGKFNMQDNGTFLYTVNYGFSNFIQAHIKSSLHAEDAIGLDLTKDGLASFGIEISDKILTLDEIKIIIGKLTYLSVDQFFPILTDVQRNLLNTLYGVEDILKSHFAVNTYSLIITDTLGVDFEDTDEFLEKYPRKLGAITDWVIDHKTIENCHVFVGMRATVVVGTPSENLKTALEMILFHKTVFNASFRLFSLIWSMGKTLKLTNEKISNATYKQLKALNSEISSLNNNISMLEVLDEMLEVSLDEYKVKWDESEAKRVLPQNIFRIEDDFKDNLEKADDRDLVSKQLHVDLESLRESTTSRMDLIMTKNSEFLNLVLLVLTLISVIGVADFFDLGLGQYTAVGFAMIPFIIATIVYLRNYLKNFR